MKPIRLLATLLLSLFAGIALAGPVKPYDQATFDNLTKAGKPVVVANESWPVASGCCVDLNCKIGAVGQ